MVNVTNYHLADGLNQYEGVPPSSGGQQAQGGSAGWPTCPHTQPLKESLPHSLLACPPQHHSSLGFFLSFFFCCNRPHEDSQAPHPGVETMPLHQKLGVFAPVRPLITGFKAHVRNPGSWSVCGLEKNFQT